MSFSASGACGRHNQLERLLGSEHWPIVMVPIGVVVALVILVKMTDQRPR